MVWPGSPLRKGLLSGFDRRCWGSGYSIEVAGLLVVGCSETTAVCAWQAWVAQKRRPLSGDGVLIGLGGWSLAAIGFQVIARGLCGTVHGSVHVCNGQMHGFFICRFVAMGCSVRLTHFVNFGPTLSSTSWPADFIIAIWTRVSSPRRPEPLRNIGLLPIFGRLREAGCYSCLAALCWSWVAISGVTSIARLTWASRH